MINRVKQVMMITPVNGDKNEAQQITHKDGPQAEQRRHCCLMRNFYFEHHNGNYDGNYSITECFKTGFGHKANVNEKLFFCCKRCKQLPHSLYRSRSVA